MQQSSTKKVLGIFSQAFVINLEGSHERMNAITRRLYALGVEFERFPAIKYEGFGLRVGTRACGMSHLEVVKEAQRRNLESVLIIEDDAVFRPNFLDLWIRLLPELQNLDYDLLYGYDWSNVARSSHDIRIKPIRGTLCCHFWAVHFRFYASFIERVTLKFETNASAAIDRIFNKRTARIYAPTYNLVGQDEGKSTIEGNWKKFRWSACGKF